MTNKNDETDCFAVVRNIPKYYHSADLRDFFSRMIEEDAFSCFHYKHRPEGDHKGTNCPKKNFMCVVSFSNHHNREKVVNAYNGKNWTTNDGSCVKQKCCIFKVSIKNDSKGDAEFSKYSTRSEKSYMQRHAQFEDFDLNDLLTLSELNPPVHVMPHGNVGTSIPVFLELIKQCKLPSSVIKKLNLVFPSTGSTRIYGNVSYRYSKTPILQTSQSDDHEQDSALPEKVSDSESDDFEEWDRYEALHSDVTTQERTKERLFEEEIELKWEKGGSGLVFYTDAQYWAEEEGDFDEQNTDDWDVDVSEFYGEPGDRDAKSFVEMRKEKRLRDGQGRHRYGSFVSNQIKVNPRTRNVITDDEVLGRFERHTKGMGRKIMLSHGWEDSKPLGRRGHGIVKPILVSGKLSTARNGLGYTEMKTSLASVASTPGTRSVALTSGTRSVPSTSGARSVPSTSGTRSVPLTSGARSVPSTSGTRSVALTSGTRSVPSTSGTRSVPSTSVTRSVPSTSGTRSVPSTSGTRSVPSTSGTRSVPSTSGARSVPSTSGTRSVPSTSGARRVLPTSGTQYPGVGVRAQEVAHPPVIVDKDTHVLRHRIFPTSGILSSTNNSRSTSQTNNARGLNNRTSLIPGVDGVVISTIYDSPLDVDLDQGVLRSQLPTALKRRRTEMTNSSSKQETSEQQCRSKNSKLVNFPRPSSPPSGSVDEDRAVDFVSKTKPRNLILVEFVKSSETPPSSVSLSESTENISLSHKQ